MAFPPQFPDVNSIEHLWDEIKREKVQHEVTSQDNLWDVLSACWNNIEPSTQSMPK
jgi:transposase